MCCLHETKASGCALSNGSLLCGLLVDSPFCLMIVHSAKNVLQLSHAGAMIIAFSVIGSLDLNTGIIMQRACCCYY
jgi:hypothetical protein